MGFSKQLATIVTSAAVGGLVALGASVAVNAGADTTNTAYYACLKAGKLTSVGTVAPTSCSGGAPISWNSQGVQGVQGPAGAQGPVGATANTCASPPGPNENFSYCNLSSQLTPAVWGFADLHNTLLIGSQLPYASLSLANLSGANLSGAWIGYADLSGADLSGASLSHSGLYSANLTGANLTGANLTNANLVNVSLTGANFTGAILTNATCPNGVVHGSLGANC